MRVAILLGVVGWLAVALPPPAGAQETAGPAVVVMAGQGEVEADPDIGYFTLTAEARASSPREAESRAGDLMRPAIERLRANAIADDAIRTTGFDVRPEFEFVNGRRVSRGFLARTSAVVRVDAIGRFSEMLAIALAAGVTEVGGVRFEVSNRAALEREALRLAVADARARAAAAASGAGMTVARVLRIDEQGGARLLQAEPVMAARELAADGPPVVAGPVRVRAEVTLTAEID